MTIKKRPMNADGTRVERRKSHRFDVVVPLEVSWRGTGGVAMKQEAVARQVNAKGGFLKMTVYPELGTRITLVNFFSAQTVDARVLATPSTREGISNGIVIELIAPSETFWGVNMQLEKTNVELKHLEKALLSEGIDLRLLKEYRDAVDYIRTTAATVQQLRQCQLRALNDGELQSRLASERVQRTINLCLEVTADVDAGRLNEASQDFKELSRITQNLHTRLGQVATAKAQTTAPRKSLVARR